MHDNLLRNPIRKHSPYSPGQNADSHHRDLLHVNHSSGRVGYLQKMDFQLGKALICLHYPYRPNYLAYQEPNWYNHPILRSLSKSRNRPPDCRQANSCFQFPQTRPFLHSVALLGTIQLQDDRLAVHISLQLHPTSSPHQTPYSSARYYLVMALDHQYQKCRREQMVVHHL